MPPKTPAIRAVIVDDEKPARDRIRRLLAPHADIALVGEASDVASAVALLAESNPDLLFLDVQMPGGDGFDVLRRAKRIPRVIFTTAFDQYAVRAFEVNSLDYLLKPFDKARFAAALDRAREALSHGETPAKGATAADRGAGNPPETQVILRLLEEIRAGLPGGSDPGHRNDDAGEAEDEPDAADREPSLPAPPAASHAPGVEGPGSSAGRLTRIAGKRA